MDDCESLNHSVWMRKNTGPVSHTGPVLGPNIPFFPSGRMRLGFEVKRTSAPRLTSSMRNALHDLRLSRLDVVHAGDDTFHLAENVRAVAILRLLDDLEPLR